jgi:hypothetical protein
MESFSPATIAAALLLALPLVACGPSDETSRAESGPIKGPFIVSSYFTPSGLMGDGAVPGRVTVDINKNCKQPRPPNAQGDCYRFLYIPSDVHWAGAYWVFPANNWGAVRGREVVGPVDLMIANPDKPGTPNLRGYHHARVTFAMGDPNIELHIPPSKAVNVVPIDLHAWVGRLDGRTATPTQPYYDEGCAVFPGSPPVCTDMTKMPPVPYVFQPAEQTMAASGAWNTLTIDLSFWSIERLLAGFGFSTNDNNNVGIPQIIYLDDIVWE